MTFATQLKNVVGLATSLSYLSATFSRTAQLKIGVVKPVSAAVLCAKQKQVKQTMNNRKNVIFFVPR
jgi:hypothetical protein